MKHVLGDQLPFVVCNSLAGLGGAIPLGGAGPALLDSICVLLRSGHINCDSSLLLCLSLLRS